MSGSIKFFKVDFMISGLYVEVMVGCGVVFYIVFFFMMVVKDF